MLSNRDPLQNKQTNKKPTQAESERIEKIFQANEQEKNWGSNTYIRQSRFQNKGHKKRQRRTPHNT